MKVLECINSSLTKTMLMSFSKAKNAYLNVVLISASLHTLICKYFGNDDDDDDSVVDFALSAFAINSGVYFLTPSAGIFIGSELQQARSVHFILGC